jgi:hypothetical protein
MYRFDRNRKRSKRRGISCPNDWEFKQLSTHALLVNSTTVALSGEWLEDFWGNRLSRGSS